MITSQAVASVENLLSQMRAVTKASQGISSPEAVQTAGDQGGFAAELSRTLDRVSSAQNAAHAQAQAFELGDPDVALSNVMIDLQKANLAFQATLQVRNRLVDAYKEIANMAV